MLYRSLNRAEEMFDDGERSARRIIRAMEKVIRELASVHSSKAVNRRKHSTYGIRNLLAVVPAVRALTASAAIRSLVEPVLGKEAVVARGIFFDKTPETNWSVAWHQDLAVAV